MTVKAQLLLAQGINLMAERKERKRAVASNENSFEKIAIKWFENQKGNSWSTDYRTRAKKWITEDAKK